MGNKHDYNPSAFQITGRGGGGGERERRVRKNEKKKGEVLCDGSVKYKLRVKGAPEMKREQRKKFGREEKKRRKKGEAE